MNVLIVEDEPRTASLLQELIQENPDFLVVDTLESVVDAVEYLVKHQNNLDLLFFDIQLADGKSFEIFKHVDVHVPVVFCTAYDEFSFEAIKNNGIDYVLKPFKEEEIQAALEKYAKLFRTQKGIDKAVKDIDLGQNKRYQNVFISHARGKSLVHKTEDIALFYIDLDTVYVATFSGKTYPIFKKMDYIESVCDPTKFFRISRQMLVNRDAILSFEDYVNRKICLELVVKTDNRPIVSRLKVSEFKHWLES